MKFDNDGLNVKLSAARPNPWTKRLHLDLPLMGGLSALIVLAFVIL